LPQVSCSGASCQTLTGGPIMRESANNGSDHAWKCKQWLKALVKKLRTVLVWRLSARWFKFCSDFSNSLLVAWHAVTNCWRADRENSSTCTIRQTVLLQEFTFEPFQEFLHLGPLEVKLLCVTGQKKPIHSLDAGLQIVDGSKSDVTVTRPVWPIHPSMIRSAVQSPSDVHAVTPGGEGLEAAAV